MKKENNKKVDELIELYDKVSPLNRDAYIKCEHCGEQVGPLKDIIYKAIQRERERVKQIVIEDVPWEYQDRLLKDMEKTKYKICEECGASCKEVDFDEYKKIKKQKGLYGYKEIKDWRKEFDRIFVRDDDQVMDKYSWYKAEDPMGPNRTQDSIKIFIEELLEEIEIEHQKELKEVYEDAIQQERERINDAYDKGSAEATMVCNEKTIPHAIKQERERIIEEIEKMNIWSKGTAEGTHKDIIYRLTNKL